MEKDFKMLLAALFIYFIGEEKWQSDATFKRFDSSEILALTEKNGFTELADQFKTMNELYKGYEETEKNNLDTESLGFLDQIHNIIFDLEEEYKLKNELDLD